jgi:hypothetical protein
MMIHKVTVNNQDFKTVLKSTKVGKKLGKANYSFEEVEFRYIAGQLKVTVIGAEKVIAASGMYVWSASIELSKYQRLIMLPPIADPLNIEFDEEKGRLKIGTTAFVICS